MRNRLFPTSIPKESTERRYGATVRFAGAQIPVTRDINTNVKEIKEAIDYAKEVNADFLVTPEAALSGYYEEFMETAEQYQNLQQGEHEVVSYARENDIGLCLGTLFLNNEDLGQIKRNQIRFYNKSGDFVGAYNKIQTIHMDKVVPGNFKDPGVGATENDDWGGHPIVMLKKDANTAFETSALICNDMYGENLKGEAIARRVLYQLRTCENPLSFIIHPTYGLRGDEVIDNIRHPEFGGGEHSPEYMHKIRTTMEEWTKAHLEMLSYQLNMSFFVVDTCSDFTGNISEYKTSSPSGVVERGEWVTPVDRIGKQYFHHDFDVRTKLMPPSREDLYDRISTLTKSNPKPVEE
jgi:hypothetical protein|tara:strand:- start:158 stop:1210 length:1053 start_codon:yes stop_codon:yes gene_type:complete